MLQGNATPCSIYVVDLERATGMTLPPRYTPSTWYHNQYAVELWLRRAIENHPWRVSDPSKADLIFAAANFSMWCVAMKRFSRRRLWEAAFHPEKQGKPRVMPDVRVPVFIALQYEGACGPAPFMSGREPHHILLREEIGPYEHTDRNIVSPFLVSKPRWLVGDDPMPFQLKRWDERKLIFFAGHVPKPYLRDTRYCLWRQMRNDPRATVLSPTLYCTVGGFVACRHNAAFLEAQNITFFTEFCRFACAGSQNLGGSGKIVWTACLGTTRKNPKLVPILRQELKDKCKKGYAGVNYDDELADMRRDTRRLPHPEYLRLAMSHRFCLVAPGDFVSTHKVSEAMALGAAGGCIPVFVLPNQQRKDVDLTVDITHYLPYTRWLDWCEVAFFVSELHAREEFGSVLEMLDRIPEVELTAKRERLKQLRDAFVFREQSSMERPSAAEHILAEACSAARRMPALHHAEAQQRRLPPESKGGDHQRCILVSERRRKKPRGHVRIIANAGLVTGGYRFQYDF